MSALLYWTGVLIHAYRLRKRIGRSPNLKPHGTKEGLLWGGWFFVIAGWIGQPLIIENPVSTGIFSFLPPFHHLLGIPLGIVLLLCGHSGTLWCYTALGDSWRMGINSNEKTALVKNGPYRWVRHPIYLFQIIILIGVVTLLPTLFSFMLLLIHFVCVVIKASDEEAYLSAIHGPEYYDYLSSTGRFFPGWESLRRSNWKEKKL